MPPLSLRSASRGKAFGLHLPRYAASHAPPSESEGDTTALGEADPERTILCHGDRSFAVAGDSASAVGLLMWA